MSVAASSPDYPSWPLKRTLLLSFAGAALMAVAVSTQTYVSMITHGHSFVRLTAWQLCSWSTWALVSPIILRLGAGLTDRSVPLWSKTWRSAAAAVAFVAGHHLIAAQLMVWFQPYVPVSTYTFATALGSLNVAIIASALVPVVLLSIGYSAAVAHRARTLEVRESRLEADLARARLDALRLEIEPHFLFNTLHSIASLIRARSSDRALTMLLGLSELLRATLDGREHSATLKAEVAFVRQYVELQLARFGDRLDVEYTIAPEAEACIVPTFLLQPLVENAFRHGIARRPGRRRLQIGAALDGDRLHVWVGDDGAGFPAGVDPSQYEGTGLRNTRLRLERFYDGAARLALEAGADGGALAHVHLPVSAGERLARAAS